MSETTVIQLCAKKCTHVFQDETYGLGMRVHIVGKEGKPRCTVCGPRRQQVRLEEAAEKHDKKIHNNPR